MNILVSSDLHLLSLEAQNEGWDALLDSREFDAWDAEELSDFIVAVPKTLALLVCKNLILKL